MLLPGGYGLPAVAVAADICCDAKGFEEAELVAAVFVG